MAELLHRPENLRIGVGGLREPASDGALERFTAGSCRRSGEKRSLEAPGRRRIPEAAKVGDIWQVAKRQAQYQCRPARPYPDACDLPPRADRMAHRPGSRTDGACLLPVPHQVKAAVGQHAHPPGPASNAVPRACDYPDHLGARRVLTVGGDRCRFAWAATGRCGPEGNCHDPSVAPGSP